MKTNKVLVKTINPKHKELLVKAKNCFEAKDSAMKLLKLDQT